ncbi:MAG: sigma-70 family RNA polymerase sigma factor [Anaerolineae bacterium]|jgi:RNA polymerase sigma-70 factor (ECF subfamily)
MDEQALIQAAQRGDLNAFNELVLSYQGQVYNLAYRIMGEGDSAADATQEAFISAYRAIGNYRGGSFRAWLMRIVTNACYDELRRRKRRPTSSLDALYVTDAAPDGAFTSHNEGPEAYAQRQDLNQMLHAGLQTLPEDQRVVIVLSDVQGYNYKEIAEMTGASLGTVKSRLSRGRAKMRDYLLARGELLPAEYRLLGK